MRRTVLVMAAMLAAGGCQGKTADQWLKEKLLPTPTVVHVARIESNRPDLRREALETVAKDSSARREPSVVKLFCLVAQTDPDALVRAAAVRGLGLMDGQEVLAVLGQAATADKDAFVRTDAAASLGLQAKPEAVPALAQVLAGDPNSDVRVAAADALRRIKSKAAAQALVVGLKDSHLAVSERSWESLRYMTGMDLPRQYGAWEDYLAASADPLLGYGSPPAMPKGQNQRPLFTKGPLEFLKELFAKDVREAELE